MKHSLMPAIGLASLLALGGCASVQQAIQAYGSVAVTGARAANDTLVDGYKVGFCALPLSAVLRHPEIIPALRQLCVPPGDQNAQALLDAIVRQSPEIRVLPAPEIHP